jgi:hypothetical protein
MIRDEIDTSTLYHEIADEHDEMSLSPRYCDAVNGIMYRAMITAHLCSADGPIE